MIPPSILHLPLTFIKSMVCVFIGKALQRDVQPKRHHLEYVYFFLSAPGTLRAMLLVLQNSGCFAYCHRRNWNTLFKLQVTHGSESTHVGGPSDMVSQYVTLIYR